MKKTTKEMIEVMEWFDKGGEVEIFSICDNAWIKVSSPTWNWLSCDYRIKEYSYPMWFENIHHKGLIIRFDSIDKGTCVAIGSSDKHSWVLGETCGDLVRHTDTKIWTQVDEPKLEQKITIEKWLVKIDEVSCIVEVDDIDLWVSNWDDVARISKVQLVDSYEITIK